MDSVTVPPVQGASDLTVEWCNAALARSLGDARVVGVTTEPVGTGQVADTVRLHLTYEPPSAGPATLVAKVPAAEETSRSGARLTRTYEIESSFYRDLAPVLPVRTPRCHHTAHDPQTDAYVVLLEDVSPARQGDQMAGCPVDDVAAAIDELVLLQGPRWGDDALTEIGWLHRGQPEQVDGIVGLVTYAVGPFKEHYTERLDADTVALVDRLVPHLGGYLRRRPRPWTVVHGDFRADNLLFGGDRVVVVDWQTVGLGPGPSDLSYLLGASLTPDDRRRHEGTLVDRYVEGLASQGVALERDAIWQQYRRYAFGGLIMAIVASALVRRTDRGDDMFVTMAERHARQALDLDAETLIQEDPVTRLTALDEYFVHQIPEPLPAVVTHHQHWRESLFFVMHPPDRLGDVVILTMAHFPARGELDSLQLGMVDGTPTMARHAREAGDDPHTFTVGPVQIEIVEAFQQVRLHVSDGIEVPVALDLTFTARTPAYGLRRGTMRAGHELIWDQSHMLQSGTYSGTYTHEGRARRVEDWWGQRDHSWGIRDHARCPFWMWLAIQLPDGMLGVWHWELANGARIYTDGCFAPASGGLPVPVVDLRHELEWVDADGGVVSYARDGGEVAGIAGHVDITLEGGREIGIDATGRWAQRYGDLGGGLNQVEVVTDDGRRGTGIYELTGAHHHRYFPIPRAERLPA